MGGVCKCASAIWSFRGVFFLFFCFSSSPFEEEWQASQQHGQDLDLFLWSWILRLDDQPLSRGMEKIKAWLCYVENRVQGYITLEGTPRAIWVHLLRALVFSSSLISTHTLPSPTHLCTFVHSSCEVPFWGWEHNYNRRIATTLTKSLKRYSQTEIRDSRSTPSPTSCVYNHIFVLPFRVEKKIANRWRKIHETLNIWSECSSRKKQSFLI